MWPNSHSPDVALRLLLDDLERAARRAGFEDLKALLTQWYVIEGMSLIEVGERLHIHENRVRKHLARYGIPLRHRGGAHIIQLVITDDLVNEIARDGIPLVADRLGLEHTVLYTRIRRWLAGQQGPLPDKDG